MPWSGEPAVGQGVSLTSSNRSGTPPSINVLVVDDHALLRQALTMLIGSRPGMRVVGECGDGRRAIELARQLRPDIILMDVAMPGLDGLEATRRIKREAPESRVILLTSYADRERLREGFRAGARGYVVKRSDVDELLLAIQMVLSGNTYVSTELANRVDVGQLMYEAQQPPERVAPELSDREREVLQLIVAGRTGREIAATLFISEKTVEGHSMRVMAKVGARNRAELVAMAIRRGLVLPYDDDWRRQSG